MKKLTIDYCPHKNQRKVHNDPARFRILACGRRWGKTVLAINELIKYACVSNTRNWYVGPTYRQAKMIAFEMIKRYLPEELIEKINLQDLEFSLKNGSKITLKGCDNEDSLRGVGLHFVVMDEFGMMKSNVWEEIIRPMLTDTQGKALFIGTPQGKNSFWELWLKGQKKEAGYSSYQHSTKDNPYIPEYEVDQAKEQLSPRYFRQEYEASFEDFTGLIWPEFVHTHIVDPFEIPKDWERVGAIDPAMSGTTACLSVAVDYEGTIYFYNEYYEQNKRVSEVCDTIREWNIDHWIIDPASKMKSVVRQGNLYSLFDEYSDNGIYPVPGENDVMAGINRVAEYFKADKIRVFRTCSNLIWELERYHWSEEKETVNGIVHSKPFKKNDHLCDVARYLTMSRPRVGIKENTPELHRYSIAWQEEQDKQRSKVFV